MSSINPHAHSLGQNSPGGAIDDLNDALVDTRGMQSVRARCIARLRMLGFSWHLNDTLFGGLFFFSTPDSHTVFNELSCHLPSSSYRTSFPDFS